MCKVCRYAPSNPTAHLLHQSDAFAFAFANIGNYNYTVIVCIWEWRLWLLVCREWYGRKSPIWSRRYTRWVAVQLIHLPPNHSIWPSFSSWGFMLNVLSVLYKKERKTRFWSLIEDDEYLQKVFGPMEVPWCWRPGKNSPAHLLW